VKTQCPTAYNALITTISSNEGTREREIDRKQRPLENAMSDTEIVLLKERSARRVLARREKGVYTEKRGRLDDTLHDCVS
jgi:hypothetical protein